MSDSQEKPAYPSQPTPVESSGPEHEGQNPQRNNAPFPETTVRGEDVSEQSSTNFRKRLRSASLQVRKRANTLADALGRPHEREEDGLDASLLPEHYGATDDLNSFAARKNNDEEDKLHAIDHNAQTQLLIEQLGFPGSHRQGFYESRSSGASTPEDIDDASAPVSGGMLSNLLRVYANDIGDASRMSLASTPSEMDPKIKTLPSTKIMPTRKSSKKEKVKWYNNENSPKSQKGSRFNLNNLQIKKPSKPNKDSGHYYASSLVSASMEMGRIGVPNVQGPPPMSVKERKKQKRKAHKNVQLTVHIAKILARQQYIMQLCRAFMMYGAPTHRLEEYMAMTSNVLDIKAQFLYIPGCMFMSFDDPLTRTAEVKVIRVIQGLDLSRLAITHSVYKKVVHDVIGVEQATEELDDIMKRKPRYNKWILVLLTGLASVTVGPYSFNARPIDLPIIFMLGCIVGFMQYILAPSSATYSNVLEVSAAILTSFLARAFGSIKHNGEYVFCFAAMAESSIAMILPGFSVLCSSLELQSHQMNAGSIRMVFTIIYSLFLGYGVTVGTTIYGLMDHNATTQESCPTKSLDAWGNEYIQHFPFVALFCLFAAVINQAKPKQLPVTVFLGVCGYVANYFSTKRLGSNQVANTVGAFTIGLLANLYSRLWHGHAAAAIIPGIFTLVPSGLASSGSIITGLSYAEQVANGTISITSGATAESSLTSLGYAMIQTAIGISVGLFISALIVYPHGKKRSGIFSL
ncbi:hypothetical protein BGW36DRAFT_387355 [Talaromyces proteolyticus]|uniref:Pheromone-regulated membrane protein 10 n=1 Tax=Talaromyces proteolyticus TaxID=1131652 RepID=A0AAD4KIB8_9EURO|nr:uncharacterized protein BGW36DRAFT_387355 [Talaromyces proteolyticus]KAH8692310.1 hypothetical protein BGW36DRAFT_387355 [Talaromyces proteolyticus]